LHAVRTPAWRSAYEGLSSEAIRDTLARERQEPHIERAAIRAFISDRLQVDALLRQVPRLASLLMSMHWTLVEFDEPLIAGCDQPVVCVPRLLTGQRLPITAMPREGPLRNRPTRGCSSQSCRRTLLRHAAHAPRASTAIRG